MFKLDPASTLHTAPHGGECAMVEMLVLMALQHGASKLEYRTIAGQFRVAEITGCSAYEYPQPPQCVRVTTMEHLRKMFSMSQSTNDAETELLVGSSLARASCSIKNNELDATVRIIRNFEPATNLMEPMDQFWHSLAAEKGCVALLAYHARRFVWRIEDWANHAMNRSRGSNVISDGS